MKFVKLHMSGSTVLINLDKVEEIEEREDGRTIINMHNEFLEVDESFEEMEKIVGAAQGGIPMEPSKMY